MHLFSWLPSSFHAGPPGAALLMTALPLVIFGLYFGCNADHCVNLNPLNEEFLQWKSVAARTGHGGTMCMPAADHSLLSTYDV